MGNNSTVKRCAVCNKSFHSPRAKHFHIVSKGHYSNTRTIKASRYLQTTEKNLAEET